MLSWAQPIVVNDRTHAVHIGLFPEDNRQIQYEIYTEVGNGEEKPDKVPEPSRRVVHCQGVAIFSALDKLPSLDLPGLRTTTNQRHIEF